MKDKLKIATVAYKSAKKVVIAYFRGDWPKISESKLLEKKTNFQLITDSKAENDVTVKQLINKIKKMGYWGFCQHTSDKKYKEIHYWISDTNRPADDKLLALFAHEMAHATCGHSEKKACAVADICEFSYNILETIKNENKKNNK